MFKVAVLGAGGYTGGELLRILSQHPDVTLAAATSEQSAGQPIDKVFPNLKGRMSLALEPLNLDRLIDKADLFFLALPHTTAMPVAARLIQEKKRVIDLSADFRLKDPKVYERWYKTPHLYPGLLAKTRYGLPELHRNAIKSARLVANPGCYPTGALLGLLPLFRKPLIDAGHIIIDAKSGISGAGRSPGLPYHFPEAHEAVSAYSIGRHRHRPEIEQELSGLIKKRVTVTFTPHLVPINRGILSTIYVKLTKPNETDAVLKLYQDFYKREPFVQVLPSGELPNTRNVQGSNDCHIGLVADGHADRGAATLVVVTAIDNLVKGAAGQAVQNMNLMMGYEESLGLTAPGLFP
ncbi:MAG TPA: N-acetyl-gamma-glutamyl-phosphate reductase [Nitrospiria bacterium]|nr:N-acetyl-gamma-glutamyl-phosphate reductase [Nitrospiria bacterium]